MALFLGDKCCFSLSQDRLEPKLIPGERNNKAVDKHWFNRPKVDWRYAA